MAIPDYQGLMLPVLQFAGDRKEHSLLESREKISAQLNLSERELTDRLPRSFQTIFASRVGWAVTYLRSAGAVRTVRRGVYQITARGLDLLKSNPSQINVNTLRQYAEFRKFHPKGSQSAVTRRVASPTTSPRRKRSR